MSLAHLAGTLVLAIGSVLLVVAVRNRRRRVARQVLAARRSRVDGATYFERRAQEQRARAMGADDAEVARLAALPCGECDPAAKGQA